MGFSTAKLLFSIELAGEDYNLTKYCELMRKRKDIFLRLTYINLCIFALFIIKMNQMIKHLSIIGLVLCVSISSFAQSFGIRAGLNYTKFSGPLEQGVNESFGIANGFHFGINYAYKFTEDISLKGEIVYTQIGSKYNYEGESFYKVPLGNAFIYEKGNSIVDMKVSNAYITVPITLQWQASKKFEFNAGVYVSYLIGPRGTGTIRFTSTSHPDSLFFKQSLIHNYNSDAAGGIATNTPGPAVFLEDGTIVTLARDAGAYYNYLSTEKEGNLYKRYDFGLTGGLSYFINKGFYFGLRYNIGLVDITNNLVDYERKNYDEVNNKFILSTDFDRNVGLEASFGFRF